MNLKTFLDFVEIRTKIASVVPFVLGILFAYYRYDAFNLISTAVFLISLITLDMATTAINHYEGFKKGEDSNPLKDRGISKSKAVFVISFLLTISISTGLFLVYRTDYLILFIGIISFAIAVLYSFGPVPISATPLGEFSSGGLMGFVIFFIALYIQIFDSGVIGFTLNQGFFSLSLNFNEIFPVFIVALPISLMIANIMLANNICDVESDIEKRRYTLPHYLGNRASVILWSALYGFSYFFIVLGVLLRILPLFSLLVLISMIPTIPLMKAFMQNQDKQLTFVNSIKIFSTISGMWIFSFILQILIKRFL
jgi:1,4-dihydroxy-2-naphthoate octaprenyltransferase